MASTTSPQWLRPLIEDQFFMSCPSCVGSARDTSLNFWDIEAQQKLCSLCLANHPDRENVLQVRRSSYHDVVKVADITRIADISGIQSYVINGSKVVFLRRRPQPRPPKGAVGASQCTVCSRHLQDVSHYCSMQCKLDAGEGIKCVSLVPKWSTEDSRSSGGVRMDSSPDTPHHRHLLKPLLDSGSDSDTSDESHLAKRRKGLPLRSPME